MTTSSSTTGSDHGVVPRQRDYHPIRGGRATNRISDRAALGASHLAFLAAHLQARDVWLIRMLHEHKIFTSHQITQLAWNHQRRANRRLALLHQWRILDRFRPFTATGSAPWHYVLDIAGATILAQRVGTELSQLGYRHDRELTRAHSPHLAHTIAVNEFHTTLVQHTRYQDSAGTLTAWWSEPTCTRLYGDLVRPDAYAQWQSGNRLLEWFLEIDLGTYDLQRVTAKLDGYQQLAQSTNIQTPLLFWFPTTTREARARTAFTKAVQSMNADDDLHIATTTGEAAAPPLDPTAPRWRMLNDTAMTRYDLDEMAQHLGEEQNASDLSQPPETPGASVPSPIPP